MTPMGYTATAQDTSRGFCPPRPTVLYHDVFRTLVEFAGSYQIAKENLTVCWREWNDILPLRHIMV